MNKTNLQKELLEKVREGIKPSDLKKKPLKPSPKEVLPPPIAELDEGYISEGEIATNRDKSLVSNQAKALQKPIPTPPPLPNSQVKNLQAQVKALQRQIQVYQDFKKADLK